MLKKSFLKKYWTSSGQNNSFLDFDGSSSIASIVSFVRFPKNSKANSFWRRVLAGISSAFSVGSSENILLPENTLFLHENVFLN